jgi:hypothetical protein
MRMPRSVVGLAVCDGIVFISLAVWRALAASLGQPFPPSLHAVYQGLSMLGLVLGAYGFIVLVRRGQAELKPATICILFALVPGCAALVTLLGLIGGDPV